MMYELLVTYSGTELVILLTEESLNLRPGQLHLAQEFLYLLQYDT
jgi:hypothetical protein